jgi:diguanylate cyclase (GGDEF)-like protein
MPNTNASHAIEIGERVRAAVQDLAIPHATSSYQTVTVSVGVASLRPNEALNPNDLLEAADVSLYVAKRNGRNRVAEHGLGQAAVSGAAALAS